MRQLDMLIRNGRVAALDGEPIELSIGVQDGRIACLGSVCRSEARRVVDADGLVILPGVVDLHTHLRSCSSDSELFLRETASAVAGGVTTLGDFGYPHGTLFELDAATKRDRLEAEALCDFCVHTVVKVQEDLATADTRTVKVFFSASGAGGQADGAVDLLAQAVIKGHQVLAHVEEWEDYLDIVDFFSGSGASGRVHILHVPHQRFVSLKRAVGDPRLTLETCPHYLLWETLTDSVDCDVNPAVVPCDLWPELASDGIDAIGTDHCSYSRKEKNTFGLPGFPGLESSLRLLFTYGVRAGRIGWSGLCRLMSRRPAQILGLYPRKGSIHVGADADLVLFDPQHEETWNGPEHGRGDFSPYAGRRLAGRVERTLVRGREVYRQDWVDWEAGGWGTFQAPASATPGNQGMGCRYGD